MIEEHADDFEGRWRWSASLKGPAGDVLGWRGKSGENQEKIRRKLQKKMKQSEGGKLTNEINGRSHRQIGHQIAFGEGIILRNRGKMPRN